MGTVIEVIRKTCLICGNVFIGLENKKDTCPQCGNDLSCSLIESLEQ